MTNAILVAAAFAIFAAGSVIWHDEEIHRAEFHTKCMAAGGEDIRIDRRVLCFRPNSEIHIQ